MKETKFKQTEVGLIPSDWEVKTLIDTNHIETGSTPSTSDPSNYGCEYLFVSPIDLGDDKYIHQTEKKLSKKGFSLCRHFPKNSILYTCIGSTIGKSGIANSELTSNQQINAVFPNALIDNEYLYYALQIRTEDIRGRAGQQAVPLINKTEFGQTLYLLPPTIEEQKRIAQALSDVDVIINTTEKLVAKKKALKQGTMQTLLSGKMRIQNGRWIKTTHFQQTELGSIPQEWDFIQFGQKATIVRGGSPRPIQNYLTNRTDGINWIKIGDVKPGDKYITTTEEKIIPEGKSRSREVHSGDFILSNSMSFGRPYILKLDGCIHDGWLAIQNYQETFDTDFLYYLLGSDNVFKQYIAMAAGSSVQNLNKEKVSKLQVPLPSKPEQTAIATVLSDMDSEIAALETKLAKYRQLKTGMMQQLLSGKIRLV